MLTHTQLEEKIMEYSHATLDYPFGEGTAVYKIGNKDVGNGKMFALIDEKSSPVRLSLKCAPELAEVLREKYETVLPGYHLNKKHWNTIICSWQLSDNEIFDLIRHSYELVAGD